MSKKINNHFKYKFWLRSECKLHDLKLLLHPFPRDNSHISRQILFPVLKIQNKWRWAEAPRFAWISVELRRFFMHRRGYQPTMLYGLLTELTLVAQPNKSFSPLYTVYTQPLIPFTFTISIKGNCSLVTPIKNRIKNCS